MGGVGGVGGVGGLGGVGGVGGVGGSGSGNDIFNILYCIVLNHIYYIIGLLLTFNFRK